MIIDRNTNLVAVIEDDNATRDGLRVLIEGTAGFKCSGAYRSIEQAIASQGSMHDPDVVLADIQLPGISGVEGVSKLRDKWPKAVSATRYRAHAMAQSHHTVDSSGTSRPSICIAFCAERRPMMLHGAADRSISYAFKVIA